MKGKQVGMIGALQVSLMRQMEKSTRDFADWRKEREKEVMQLRRQVGLAYKFHIGCPIIAAVILCFQGHCCSCCITYLSWAA